MARSSFGLLGTILKDAVEAVRKDLASDPQFSKDPLGTVSDWLESILERDPPSPAPSVEPPDYVPVERQDLLTVLGYTQGWRYHTAEVEVARRRLERASRWRP